jgi:hypothetical protein
MTTAEILHQWRAEIVAEIESGEAELSAAVSRLHEAELAAAAAHEHWDVLRDELSRCTRNDETLAGAIAVRRAAEHAAREAAVGAVTGARLQAANIEHVLADQRAALLQLDRALAPSKPKFLLRLDAYY